MDTVKLVPAVTHHPKSPDASAEALLRIAGIVSLTRPVPKADMFEEDLEGIDPDRPAERDGD